MLTGDIVKEVIRVMKDDFDEYAELLIAEGDLTYQYSEVTLLPLKERKALIAHAINRFIAVLEGNVEDLPKVGIFNPHVVTGSPIDVRYMFDNCLENSFFFNSKFSLRLCGINSLRHSTGGTSRFASFMRTRST